MSSRDWTDPQGVKKTYWEVVVTQIENLSPKANGENGNGNGADPAAEADAPAKSTPLADEEFV